MSVHRSGTIHPMSTAVVMEDPDLLAARLVGDAETRYRKSYGSRARTALAHDAGVAPGTLGNLQRGRHKGLKGRVRDKIMQFIAAEIQSEIRRLEHDLALAIKCASQPNSDAICEARAALDEARRLINNL